MRSTAEHLVLQHGIGVKMPLHTVIVIIMCMLAGGTFLFTLAKWIVGRIDLVKQELLTLRTNDLQHIYQELRDLRKESV